MDRRQQLLDYLIRDGTDEILITSMVDNFVFLESELDKLRDLPMIKINPKNPAQQKATPASKLYKELLQQYTNVLKVLMKVSGADESDEESPLRAWVKQHVKEV